MVVGMLALAAAAAAEQGTSERPFASGGRVRLDLSAGAYTVRAGRGDRIQVQWETQQGDGSQVKADLQVNGATATVRTTGPRNGFKVVIEVPARTDLNVDLTAGDLRIEGITGNKDVGSWAGNIVIDVGRADEYARVDASVKAGDISAVPFNARKGGLFRSFTWKGPGQYTLKVNLTAGNLVLR
jgi:hypothetical protein